MVKQFPDICINGESEESLKNGAAQIVSLVKPSWRNEDFQYKIFTDGISNKLIGVYVGNVKFPSMPLLVWLSFGVSVQGVESLWGDSRFVPAY